jgi:hypothetical protein
VWRKIVVAVMGKASKQASEVKRARELEGRNTKGSNVRLPVDTKLDFAAGTGKQPTASPSLRVLQTTAASLSSRLPSENPGRFGSLFPRKGWSDWV